MNLTKFFYYVVSLSLMGSISAAGLIIIKGLFRQKLGANWHYYIWFLLILRLVIPYTPPASFNVFSFVRPYQKTIALPQMSPPSSSETIPQAEIRTNNTNTASKALPEIKNVQKPQASSMKAWFNWQTSALIWMVGVLGIFFYIILINGLLLFKTRKLPVYHSEAVFQILQECKARLGINSKVSVACDTAVKSPAIFGLFHPKIIISPEIVDKLSSEEISYIFLHELSHLKRGDLLINGLVLGIQAVYWFNPIVWYALHQMKLDSEIACDANALAALNPEDHKKYGQTIISLLELLSEPHWAPGTLGFISKFNRRRIIMISTFKKTPIKWAAAALTLTLLAGCSSLSSPFSAGQDQKDTSAQVQQNTDASNKTSTLASSSADSNSIIYKNTQYGFNFSLPEDWKGYSIVTSEWEGLAIGGTSGEKVVETGPMISIRDPRWTSQTPRQDIPIMVFTLSQWNSLQQGVFHIGAVPIGPSELVRNNSYVFALPARYNFAFLPGYEEVEKILEGKPLQTTQAPQSSSDSIRSLLSNIMTLAKQGKVINSDFSVKSNTIEDVKKVLGKADKTDWVAAAKGLYATYASHNVVFGINKGEQIFEIRSYDSRLKEITLAKAKEALGTPEYDAKSNGQEIIGYTISSEFKVEMVFPQVTSDNPNPVMDHYNVLYPHGTINIMADDPGRQW